MKLKWKRTPDGYRSECGRYTIEKFDSVMRGSAVWWVISGAISGQKPKLRTAKRMAELHAISQASGEIDRAMSNRG